MFLTQGGSKRYILRRSTPTPSTLFHRDANGSFVPPRFREVPGFGRDTIRRFGRNVSEMKQFAARNYEDLLQVRQILCITFLPIIAAGL